MTDIPARYKFDPETIEVVTNKDSDLDGLNFESSDENNTELNPNILELDRIKSEIGNGRVTSRTIVALQYILENLKAEIEISNSVASDVENNNEVVNDDLDGLLSDANTLLDEDNSNE